MFRRLWQQSGTGAVCRLPIAAPILEKITDAGQREWDDDQQSEDEHVIFAGNRGIMQVM
jgi:hypothetical protein